MTSGDTPLHTAIRSSDLDSIKLLLERDASDINVANSKGETPLHLVMVTYNETFSRSRFPIPLLRRRCILYAKMDEIELLLKYGADVNAVDANGDTILHLLVVQPITQVVEQITELLLEHGADVNVANVNGDTPLLLSVSEKKIRGGRSHPDVTVCLLRHGADVNVANVKGETPLHLAVQNENSYYDDERLIESLLDYGADDEVVDVNGDTPFQSLYRQSVKKSTFRHTRLLIKNCRNVNLTNSEGETFLHLTVRNKKFRQVPLIKLLIDRGADVSKEDSTGENAYQAYCHSVDEDNGRKDPMLEILLQFNVQQHVDSSLHVASLFHSVDSVGKLLKLGADVNAADSFGFSPLFYALIAHEYKEDKIVDMRSTVKLLLDYGADVNHKFTRSNLPRNDDGSILARNGTREVSSLMELSYFGTSGMFHEDYRTIRYHFFKHVAKLLTLHEKLVEIRSCDIDIEVVSQCDRLVSSEPQVICNYLPLYIKEKLEVWRSRCSDELEAMSEIEIGESRLTFLDLLLASAKETAIYARNKAMVEAFRAKKGLFPMYQGMIDAKLTRELERRKLVQSAAAALSDALKFADPSDEFFERILSYCSNEDLLRVIDAMGEIEKK